MGLLDDAIREHLELKRSRGADPGEVSRLENEVLGPPQPGEFAESAETDPPPAAVESAPVYEDLEPPSEGPSVDPLPPAEPEPRRDPAGRLDELEPAPGEDVLEETPDFLQETPEHERLWFEQKPPRDFDLDR